MDRQQAQNFAQNSRLAPSIRRSLAADMSGTMEDLLCGDEGAVVPPTRTNIRVRNMGRNIKERSEVCQWIQDMTLEPTRPNLFRREEAIVKDEADMTANAASIVSKKTPAVLQHARAMGEPSQALEEKSAGGVEDSVFFEEQLNSIRQQQLELLEKKKAIQKQLEKSQGTPVGSSSSVVATVTEQSNQGLQSQSENETTSIATSSQPPLPLAQANYSCLQVKRRRLKGSLASHYAERDEGTVGLLLSAHSEDDASRPFAPTSNFETGMSAGHQANFRQSNSGSISALLSDTSFIASPSVQGSDTSFASNLPHQAVPPNSRCDEKSIVTGHNSKPPKEQTAEAEQSGCLTDTLTSIRNA